MPGLLIDRKVLIKHKLDILLNIAGSAPRTKDDIGIIFLIPKKQYDLLYTLKTKNDKISYITSDYFLDSIYGSYFIIYCEKKKICELREHVTNPNHLNDIVKSLIFYLPKDITIWAGVVPTKKSNVYIKSGFDNPHICNKSILGHKFRSSGIAFSKPNHEDKIVDEMTVHNKLQYALKEQGDLCNIYARFTKSAISYLQHINRPKGYKEKELSGALTVRKVVKHDNKIIFELSPDPSSLKTGDNEEVDAVWSRYNFHTHPKSAYENHGVETGWPSSQDYVGFLSLDNETIFHTVVTLEGIYIISLSPEWDGNLDDIDTDYIINHYHIDHNTDISFDDYVKIINDKKYEGVQLFEVKYLPWNKSHYIFPVYFAKTNDKCLATEEVFKLLKKV